jgi:hypothetical protein
MDLAMSGKIALSSLSPFFDPASENGWHGKPAQIISTGSTSSQLTDVRSPKFGLLNLFSRSLLQLLSISETHESSAL